MSHQETTTLNIPSVLAFALLSFFAIRYFFFSPRSSDGPSRPRQRNQIPYDRIESLASAFPQADRRKIEWDLLRNGGNTQATAHRILAGTLSEPPPSFRAQAPPTPVSTGTSTSRRSDGPKFENLIQRYKLDQRVAEEEKRKQEADASEAEARSEAKIKGEWSARREDRQAALKKRREDMVLEARRKMEERMKKETGTAGAS